MILYEQATPVTGKELTVHKSDLFVARMSAAFGGLPITLDKTHMERLEGLKAATLGEQSTNPFDELIRAVRRYGCVKVWEKYDPFEDKGVNDATITGSGD